MELEIIKNAKTKRIGKDIIYFEEIESTQDYAKEVAKKDCIDGTIVITDMQTKGKGTKGRSWYTTKGSNIIMSIILEDNLNISNLQGITIKIAECMKNAIKNLYNIELIIKEPNDLILNNKKISGILTQSSIIGDKVEYLVIGIGFNVNEENFNEEISNIATSLKKEFNKQFSREKIIVKFIEELEKIF